jgi:hypothetical protein
MFLVYVLILISCKPYTEKGIAVIVKNSSSSTIHDTEIGTSEKLSTINNVILNPGKEINSFLKMKENKTDGSYIILYTLANGKKENIDAGYYTNGAPIERSMYIDIQRDTTLVTFSRY